MTDVDLTQVYQFAADLTKAGPATKALVTAVHFKTVSDVERDMKAMAPVDTGALRSSITRVTTRGGSSLSTEIGPTVDYAGYPEEGTSRMAPRPYMRPAIDAHEGSYIAALEQAVGDGFR